MSQAEICARIAATLATAPIHDHLGYEALAYLKLPGPDYRQILRTLHLTLRPQKYVEIGVRAGDTIKLAAPDTLKIGIDPAPTQGFMDEAFTKTVPNTAMYVCTSDAFFERPANVERARGFGLALIDGDHSFDQALRDFENLERIAAPASIIALHDVIPMDERTAQPSSEGVSFHTGDVWRLMAALVANRPDLIAFTIACPPTGLGIVGRFGQSAPGVRFAKEWRGAAYSADWEHQRALLNIIPNEPEAILRAFNGAHAGAAA